MCQIEDLERLKASKLWVSQINLRMDEFADIENIKQIKEFLFPKMMKFRKSLFVTGLRIRKFSAILNASL